MSGALGYHSGLSAEASVAAHYRAAGCAIRHVRWRGARGEIDLIVDDGDEIVFVEVKKARDIARAAERLTQGQARRIMQTAEEFIGSEPRGALTPVRFDVALVDGAGRLHIITNALSA